ncbi:MAG: T9SS type A sorting domain-containing protein [Flavobacteriaceae bacterium]
MQKQLFFLYVLLIIFTVKAQEPSEISIDSMLVNIDKSTFTTGILYDRVTPLSRLHYFNDSINIATVKTFEQALLELYRASNEQKLQSPKQLRTLYTHENYQNVVDIGILNVAFEQVNFNEVNENQGSLRIRDSLFQKIDNANPPFKKQHLFMAAPLKLYAVGDTIVFRFNNNFIFEEAQGSSIENLTVNFDTGQSYTIIENGSLTTPEIPIVFQDGGLRTLSFAATFLDGSTRTTQAVVHTRLPAAIPSGYIISNGSINSSIPFQGYVESSSYYSKLEYRIFYHTNNGNTQQLLLNPIVIIDGFDPGDKRKIQDSDPHPNLSNEEHRSIEDMMKYFDNQGNQNNLIMELNALGFDIVIVNHPVHQLPVNGNLEIDGGADYIERNAMGHVALYQHLNATLTQNNSNKQLVVVGPSMGGQISRYALAYMEKNNIPHNTRLWISVDSPHLGANIPMGAQTLLNVVYDLLGSQAAQDFVEDFLESPAAKQQLIEQYKNWDNDNNIDPEYLDGRTLSQGFNETRGTPFFIEYYNRLFNNGLPNSLGYPQNLRKIALVNGSLTNSDEFLNPFVPDGVNTTQNPYTDDFPFDEEQTLKIKGFEDLFQVHLATLETYAMPPNNSNHKIAFFKVKKPFGWSIRDRYLTNYNSRGNMDNLPGGWYPTQWELANSTINSSPCNTILGVNICINEWDIHKLTHVSSFIPTISALGFHNPNFNWRANLNRNLVCTGEIPFDSYYGPKKNEQHTSFTHESVQWLKLEILGQEQPPVVYLNNNDLEGPQVVCEGPETYQFSNCRTSVPVQSWEVSPGLQIVTSNGTSVTVEKTTSSSIPGYVKAIFPNQTVQRDVWLGKPGKPGGANGVLEGPTLVNTGAVVTYSGGVAEGASSYTWWLPYPFEIVNPFNTTGPNWQVHPNTGRHGQVFTGNAGIDGYVQLMGHNACGDGDAVLLYVEHGVGGSGQQQNPVYPYPNTADEAFSLDFSSYPPGEYHITIFDMYSNIYYDGVSTNIEKTIITENIPNGTYFLHIYIDNELSTYQLIINH